MTPPRRRDREAKTKAILTTANTLFKQNGYANTTTNRIASEAGVSIGLLYKYFPGGKPDIVLRMIEDYREEVLVGALGDVTPQDVPRTIHGLLVEFIRLHRRIAPGVAAFEMATLEDAEVRGIGRKTLTIGSDSMKDILIKVAGKVDDEETRKWANVMFHMIDSLVHRHVLNEGLVATDEELADILTSILVKSLA
jgi:AcrR family transcriptional regulator